MRKIILITSFRNLNVKGTLKTPFSLMPGLDISNSDEEKNKLITDDVMSMIGVIEANHLFNSPNLISSEFDENHLKGGALEPFLLAILLWIKGLFRSAWVLFDHCFECEAAYLFMYEDNVLIECTSNFLAQRTTMSDCSVKEITLVQSDLEKWHDTEELIGSYLYEKDSSQLRFLMENGICRSGRSLQYIEIARTSTNMGFKIANYISAFEALFSTSSAELSYKLSERVAFFMHGYGFDKKEVFRNVRAAYEVRSKLVHGGHLSAKKIKTIHKVSAACDCYLRRIMQLCFGEDQLTNVFDVEQKKLDQYFEDLIFKK